MPLPDGTADESVLISVAELGSLRRKVELHENVGKCCKGTKKPLARPLDVQVDDPDSESAKMSVAYNRFGPPSYFTHISITTPIVSALKKLL
jgi:hypothetical protein